MEDEEVTAGMWINFRGPLLPVFLLKVEAQGKPRKGCWKSEERGVSGVVYAAPHSGVPDVPQLLGWLDQTEIQWANIVHQ